jgi:hypothetical protein
VRGASVGLRKGMATLAFTLFIVAQPQVFCALHCMVFQRMEDMEAGAVAPMSMPSAIPSEGASAALAAHEHDAVAMPCGHGMNVLTAPTLPVAAMGLATASAIEMPRFGARASVSASAAAGSVIVAYTPRVDTPPPRV